MLKRAEHVASKEVAEPDQIPRDPENQKLGVSSPHLSIHDFDLMRTLGTGEGNHAAKPHPLNKAVTYMNL